MPNFPAYRPHDPLPLTHSYLFLLAVQRVPFLVQAVCSFHFLLVLHTPAHPLRIRSGVHMDPSLAFDPVPMCGRVWGECVLVGGENSNNKGCH